MNDCPFEIAAGTSGGRTVVAVGGAGLAGVGTVAPAFCGAGLVVVGVVSGDFGAETFWARPTAAKIATDIPVNKRRGSLIEMRRLFIDSDVEG
jgi:hypothetical protein